MDYFAGLDVSVKETSVCIVVIRAGSFEKRRLRASPTLVGGAGEPSLPLQADWTGGWTAVAMAVQCARRSRLAGNLR